MSGGRYGRRRQGANPAQALAGLEEIFSSPALYATLAFFFDYPDDLLFPRQISRHTDTDIKSVIRELRKLHRIGILYLRKVGRGRYYGVEDRHPLYEGLMSLFAATRKSRRYRLQESILPRLFM